MSESVRVILRCRPFSTRESTAGYKKAVTIDSDAATVTLLPDNKQFTFDGAFDEKTSQGKVYDQSVAGIVESVCEGFNGTVFAYGKVTLCAKMDGRRAGHVAV